MLVMDLRLCLYLMDLMSAPRANVQIEPMSCDYWRICMQHGLECKRVYPQRQISEVCSWLVLSPGISLLSQLDSEYNLFNAVSLSEDA